MSTYTWLTSPNWGCGDWARNDDYQPLTFLLRHGRVVGGELGYHETGERIEQLRRGLYKVYLGFDASNADDPYWFPRFYLGPSIVLSSKRLNALSACCDLSAAYVVPLAPEWIGQHVWRPGQHIRGLTLHRELDRALELNSELPGDDEIIESLCRRYSVKAVRKDLHMVVLPTNARSTDFRLVADGQLFAAKDATLLTSSGAVAFAHWRQESPFRFQGLMFPPRAASIFGGASDLTVRRDIEITNGIA